MNFLVRGKGALNVRRCQPLRAFRPGAVLILALSFGLIATLGAKPVSIPEQNLTVEVPDEWDSELTPLPVLTSTPKPIFAAVDHDHAQCVLMVCHNLQQFTAGDPNLIGNLKANVNRIATAHGSHLQFTGEQAVELNNVPAYVLQYTLTLLDGKVLLCRSYAMAGNDRLYLFLTQAPTPEQDLAVDRVVTSLHFDSAPKLPYRHWGRRKILAVAVVAVAFLAGMTLLVAWLIYRRRT